MLRSLVGSGMCIRDSYDDELVEAVRAFQLNHGVLPSGMVAEKTLAPVSYTHLTLPTTYSV